MKKYIIRAILAISFAASLPSQAWCDTITVIPTPPPVPKDESNKGHRMPPPPVQITINPDTNEITSSQSIGDILTYEIWSEDSSICIAEFVDAAEFVSYLFSVPGSYQIRFLTDDYIYTGYISVGGL